MFLLHQNLPFPSIAGGLPPLGKNCYAERMIPPRKELAAGAGWRVLDIVCSQGPSDPRFDEWCDVVNVAFVIDGTFAYRSVQGSATMVPGGVVLGNCETCFQCGHEHSVGDRCLAFHYTPETFEEIVAASPGLTKLAFAPPSLPPLHALSPLLACAEAARDDEDADALEELAFAVASKVAAIAADKDGATPSPRAVDQRRISEIIRRIEDNPSEPLTLADLAREAGMSRYHFLRVFRDVAGVTPRQFVLHRRMHRAALRLQKTDDPVSTIAFDEGFEDLSTFNRRFRKIMGASPTKFRTTSAYSAAPRIDDGSTPRNPPDWRAQSSA